MTPRKPKPMTVFVSSVQGVATNTSYPYPAEITCVDDLRKAACFDNVGAAFADGKNSRGNLVKAYRSRKTFHRANCIIKDCDNLQDNPLLPDLSPSDWVTPADVQKAFPGVPFYVVYSRNHMKPKNGKAPRPKFHVYFPCAEITSEATYGELHKRLQELFPAFDKRALDTAHFMFGVENPTVEYFEGDTLITDFMRKSDKLPDIIPTGQRNSTLSQYAARVLKRHGDTEKALQLFREAADRCDQPLDNSELQTIWGSAQRFFHRTIASNPAYVPAAEFDFADFPSESKGRKKQAVTSDVVKQVLLEMGVSLRLNVISGFVEIQGMPPQFSRFNAANVLPTLLTDYFTKHGMRCSRQNLDDCLSLIADEYRFNPVEDMLLSSDLDGRDRISELLQIIDLQGKDREALYVKKWLHQCVALALNNDTEPYGADGVLVLQAEQGAGKTLFCSTLAMRPDWFAEGVSIDLDRKDSVIQSTGCWIAELGELDSTLKREQSALKAFLTASQDVYRLPYARTAVRKPRRTSFCATVNPAEFLSDETGSRRFWVVHPEHIDVEKLKGLSSEWLSQLWGQVYTQLYLPNPQGFRLTTAERETLQQANEQYTKSLPGEIELLDNLNFGAPLDRWQWAKVSEVRNSLHLFSVTPVQLGKVLAKLAQRDSRVQVKNVHNIKQYFLPPKTVTDIFDD